MLMACWGNDDSEKSLEPVSRLCGLKWDGNPQGLQVASDAATNADRRGQIGFKYFFVV